MNILLIISPYEPAQTPNTLRWQPLVAYFKQQGHTVSILTTKRGGYDTKSNDNGIKTYRAGYNTLLDRVYDLVGSKSRRNEMNTTVPSTSFVSFLMQRFVDKTWRKNYWPDGTKLFLKPGIKAGQQIIREDAITHIISVGLPFTCHLIAATLKKANPSLRWHMDIQDPFSYSDEFWVNNFSKYKQKNIEEEGKAFAQADSISLTNDRAKERYAELFPSEKNKMSLIPPMWHQPTSSDKYDMILFSRKIHLGYFGSFYDNVRSLLPFLKFLSYMHEQESSLFDEIQFHFVGQMDRRTLAMLEAYPEIRRYMVVHGFVNRAQAIDAMSQVDILMNIGNTTDYHLPSKVVDYLACGKPILNLISTQQDSAKRFFDGSSVPLLNVLLDEKRYADQKEAFLGFIRKDYGEITVDGEVLKPFVLKTIAERYLDVL